MAAIVLFRCSYPNSASKTVSVYQELREATSRPKRNMKYTDFNHDVAVESGMMLTQRIMTGTAIFLAGKNVCNDFGCLGLISFDSL